MADHDAPGRFVGIAVAEYDDDGWAWLDRALEGVTALGDLLDGRGFESRTVESPTRDEWADELQQLAALGQNGFEGPLILLWSGHGEVLGEGLALMLRDTPAAEPRKSQHAFRAGDLVARLGETGSMDSLVIIDSCSAGAADRDLFLGQLKQLEETTWHGQGPVFGCLVSCKGYEQVEDGAFLAQIVEVLRDGPGDLDIGIFGPLWSKKSHAVPLVAVAQAIEARGSAGGTHPRGWISPSSRIAFPNPLFDPSLPAGTVDDGIREVRGEGRRPSLLVETPAAVVIGDAVGADAEGLWMLTGGPGSGKSSCLRLARERSAEGLAVLSAADGVEALATGIAAQQGAHAVAIDGLDEAPARERAEIVDLATGWSRDRLVVVATRSTGADAAAFSIARRLGERATRVIDLDSSEWLGDAIYRYVLERLRKGTDDA
jgi:Caspase domain